MSNWFHAALSYAAKGLGLVGSYIGDNVDPVFSALTSYIGGKNQNEVNRQLVQQQQDFQERMSSTAYQRAMADMKEAGLNPILGASQGGGATTPQGGLLSMQNELENSVNTALASRRLRAEINKMKNENENIRSQTALNNALKLAAFEDAKLKANSARVAGTNDKLLRNQLPGSDAQAKIDSTTWGYIRRIFPDFRLFK